MFQRINSPQEKQNLPTQVALPVVRAGGLRFSCGEFIRWNIWRIGYSPPMKIPFLLAALVLVAPCQAQDAPPKVAAPPDPLQISTDRPGFSNGTGIVPTGHFQIEAGATGTHFGDTESYAFGQALVRIPVSARAEARVGIPSYLVSHAGGVRSSGADNLFAEGKFRFGTSKRAVYALLVNSILPTGTKSVATRAFQPGARLSSDIKLSDKLGATLNLGYVRAANQGAIITRYNQVFGSASLSYALSPHIGAFGELYAIGGNGETLKYLDGGFTQLLNPRTQLDASAGIRLGNRAGGPDYFYAVGVSRLF